MATDNQKQLIQDFESAVAAIRMKNPDRPPDGLTIAELCELAGRTPIETRAMVLRMVGKPENEYLLTRLLDIFRSVDLEPRYLAQCVEDTKSPGKPKTEPVSEEREEPRPIYQPRLITSQQTLPEPLPVIQPIAQPAVSDVMQKVIGLLEGLSTRQQRKIIMCVSTFYEIGE